MTHSSIPKNKIDEEEATLLQVEALIGLHTFKDISVYITLLTQFKSSLFLTSLAVSPSVTRGVFSMLGSVSPSHARGRCAERAAARLTCSKHPQTKLLTLSLDPAMHPRCVSERVVD